MTQGRTVAAVVVILGGCVLCPVATGQTTEEPPQTWTDDDGMLAFFQAAHLVASSSIVTTELSRVVRDALACRLDELDPYSEYLSPREWRLFKDSQRTSYAGVGMELIADRDGAMICVPYPGGPARRAGIMDGDQLIAVDGVSMEGRPLPVVGAFVRGAAGTMVRCRLVRRDGTRHTVTARREKLVSQTVLVGGRPEVPVIRITGFDSTTSGQLRRAMETAAEAAFFVILDVRGNAGGSFHEAVAAARLFLPPTCKIIELRTRAGAQVFLSTEDAPFVDIPLAIMQDAYTASAAEVFVAALTQNLRCLAFGERTFGKGVSQQVHELLDGSAMILTDGVLVTPDGTAYDGIGLEPCGPGRAVPPGLRAWWRETRAALNRF